MNKSMTKTYLSRFLALFFGCILMYGAGNLSAVAAEPATTIKNIRTIDRNDLFHEKFFSAGNPGFTGSIGFPPGANTLLILDQPQGGASLVLASPPKKGDSKNAKGERLPIKIADSINIAFDSVSRDASGFGLCRLFLLDAEELIAIKAGPQNVMDLAHIKRVDAQGFGLVNPQGMTLDPATSRLFVLDGAGPRLVSIQPKPGCEFAGAEVESIPLPSGLGELRGLAFNPEDRHLYALSADRQKLHKLTLAGELVTSLDLSGLSIGKIIQGMVFGPSLDNTDNPATCHLYLAEAKGANGEVTEWALPGPF